MKRITILNDKFNFLMTIVRGYRDGKISGTKPAEEAIEIIETWEGNDGSARGTSS